MTLAIDIGSNTIKCLLGRPSGALVDALYERTLDSRICSPDGGLVKNASLLISEAIKLFVSEARNFCPSFKIVAVATSALRDSPDGLKVVEDVRASTSVDIRILSGHEEARLSYFGAMRGVEGVGKSAFFDLGGGSLELVFGDGLNVLESFSMPVGSVRMTSKYFPGGLVTGGASLAMSEEVSKVLGDAIACRSNFNRLVGVGGGVVAARFLKRRMAFPGPESEISLPEMEAMFGEVASRTPLERCQELGIPKGRADIVPAAFLTIIGLMKFLNSAILLHTFYNIRYAVILGGI